MAPGDDESTALRKAYKKLRSNISESKRDDVMGAYLTFKDVLLAAVREHGLEDEV